MKIKLNYFIIPAIAIVISTIGRYFTAQGMLWYQTLRLPWFVLPSWVFSLVWTTIFSLTTIAVVIVWNRYGYVRRYPLIIVLFALNAIANVLWSYIFFVQHTIGLAFIDALALEASVLLLIAFILPISGFVALLLVPYALWGAFACYLNYIVWILN